MPEPITSVVFQNAGVTSLVGGFTSFGQTFQAGDLHPGQTLYAELGGRLVSVQVDVRNTYPDGSVKMAVLTLERPTLGAWQDAEATLVAGAFASPPPVVSLPGVLADHSATLSLAIEGRAPLTIDIGRAVTDAIGAGTASFWQQGPYATQARVEIPVANSSMRIVLDVTGYADGEMRFTVGLNNDRAMEAVGGQLNYTAKVVLDGTTMFDQALSHAQYQRVALDFASSDKHGVQGLGAPDQGWLNIRHDVEYLKASGAIFQYNTEFVADPGMLRFYYDEVATNPQWGDVFWAHNVATYMPGAGGRPDIGYTTGPNAHWILSQDAAAAAYALGQAKAAGYVPWNFYDLANETVLNTDNYPLLWTDGRGGTGRPGDATSWGLTQQVSGETGWTTDRAHQPELSFVPYLLTGERWIYDNLMSQASHSLMSLWPEPRGYGEGNVIRDSQMRSAAWSLRQLEHAAWAAADGSVEQEYFARKVSDNFSWILTNAPVWEATWGEIAGFIPSGVYDGYIPGWQTNMFAGVVALSALRGNDEAREVLDFMANFMLGAVLSGDQGFDPHNASTLDIPVTRNGVPLTSWSQVADALREQGRYVEGKFDSELEYQRLVVAGLTMAYYATGNEAYAEAVATFLTLNPPGTGIENYARVPQFAVTIPELHDLYRGDPRYPSGSFDPVSIEIGSGPDEIRLYVSQDYFDGPAQYRVFVNDTQVGGILTASALKSLSETDVVRIRGDFPETVSVRVQMVNDTHAGSTSRDRNLYVNAIVYNGEELPVRAYLSDNTAKDFVLAGGAPLPEPSPPTSAPTPEPSPTPEPPPVETGPFAPKTTVLGEGADQVVFKLSQDWFNGSAQYVVLVDGKQLGGVQEASALRGSGQADTLVVRGTFDDVPSTISIRFTNDLFVRWEGDRNLYVESASVNGASLGSLTNILLAATGHTATAQIDPQTLSPAMDDFSALLPASDPGSYWHYTM